VSSRNYIKDLLPTMAEIRDRNEILAQSGPSPGVLASVEARSRANFKPPSFSFKKMVKHVEPLYSERDESHLINPETKNKLRSLVNKSIDVTRMHGASSGGYDLQPSGRMYSSRKLGGNISPS
jgi:hypothetical protein